MFIIRLNRILALASMFFVVSGVAQTAPQDSANMYQEHSSTKRIPLALNSFNPHYFQFRGKPTILITSGEHYGAVLNLDFDFDRYLRELKRNGLNLTRLFVGSYREIPGSFGITDNTLAPSPNRYTCPWQRSAQPGYFDGGNRFDLNQFSDAYFKRLHAFMSRASKSGVVVEVNLFCTNYDESGWHANPMYTGNNINSVGDCPENEVYTLKHPALLKVQDAMVRKIVSELSSFDNLYYEICNEPYFGGVSLEWQHHIADVLHEADAVNPHVVSMNVANGREKIVDPHPTVSIFNFHYATPPDTVGMNYGLRKVIGENETGFRGKDDGLYRTEAWEFLLAGGGLFNNLDYSFSVAHPDGTLQGYSSPGGGSAALRDQLGILKRFLYSFDFVKMHPATSFIKHARETHVQALVEPGRQYAVYLHGGSQADLQLTLQEGSYLAEWIDTKTGETAVFVTIAHRGGEVVLHSPPYETDIALRIKTVLANK